MKTLRTQIWDDVACDMELQLANLLQTPLWNQIEHQIESPVEIVDTISDVMIDLLQEQGFWAQRMYEQLTEEQKKRDAGTP